MPPPPKFRSAGHLQHVPEIPAQEEEKRSESGEVTYLSLSGSAGRKAHVAVGQLGAVTLMPSLGLEHMSGAGRSAGSARTPASQML